MALINDGSTIRAVSDPSDELAMKTVRLLRERVGAHAQAKGLNQMIDPHQVEIFVDYLADNLVARINSFVSVGYHEPIKTTVKTPKTWWQHFKHQYFPAWLHQFFPIKYEVKTFQLRGHLFVCPHVNHIWDDRDLEKHVAFMNLTQKHVPLEERLASARGTVVIGKGK